MYESTEHPHWSAKFILWPDWSFKFILRPDWSSKFYFAAQFLFNGRREFIRFACEIINHVDQMMSYGFRKTTGANKILIERLMH